MRFGMAYRGTAFASCVIGCGCTTIVEPPLNPPDPVSVLIVDYGRHSSLILPGGDGDEMVEFAYGEWKWFALNQDQWFRVPVAMLWPTQGALGRREFGSVADAVELNRAQAEHIIQFDVDRSHAIAVRSALQRRFASASSGSVWNAEHGLTFVPDDQSYWVGHNCNHGTTDWLRQIGCRVGATTLVADFTLRPPRPTARKPGAEQSDESLLSPP